MPRCEHGFKEGCPCCEREEQKDAEIERLTKERDEACDQDHAQGFRDHALQVQPEIEGLKARVAELEKLLEPQRHSANYTEGTLIALQSLPNEVPDLPCDADDDL